MARGLKSLQLYYIFELFFLSQPAFLKATTFTKVSTLKNYLLVHFLFVIFYPSTAISMYQHLAACVNICTAINKAPLFEKFKGHFVWISK